MGSKEGFTLIIGGENKSREKKQSSHHFLILKCSAWYADRNTVIC